MYCFARDSVNDYPSLPIAALRDAWAQADGTPSRLHDLVTEQLAETAADAEAFELDLSVDGYDFILQDIVRRSETLSHVSVDSGFHLFEDAAGRVRRHGDAHHSQRDHQRIHDRPPRKVARRRLPVTLRLHDIACLSLNSPRSPRGLFAFWRLPMIWTDDRVQTLTHRWQDGYSASLIGAELGFSRNAIIGKVQRLTLASRKTVVSRRPPRAPRPALSTATRPKRAPSPPPAGRSRKFRTRTATPP